jgi:peptidoglycan biosynthesis protein MviN/MurJ (putative lipid II flippase)
LGHWGLALGTSLGMFVNFMLLTWYYQRILPDPLSWHANASFLLKVMIITMGVAAACWAGYLLGVTTFGTWPLSRVWMVLVPMAASLVAYLSLVYALGIGPLFTKALRKKNR